MSEERHDRPRASTAPQEPAMDRVGADVRSVGKESKAGRAETHSAERRPAVDRSKMAQRRPASKTGKKKKKRANGVLVALATAAALLAALPGGIRRCFSAVNHRLDFLRKGEVRAVIVNCALGGAALFIALCVLMACRPVIDGARARHSAASGNVETALRIVHDMENRGCSDAKVNQTRLSVAEGFIRAGKFAEARSVLSDMLPSGEVTALVNRANYGEAEALFASGDYSGAAQMFYPLSGYEDSAGRYADCRCALAIQAWLDGKEASARSLLLDVPDVAARVAAVAEAAAGDRAADVLAADLFQPEKLNHLEETMAGLLSARETMPRGKIAAGKFHTVGLKADGTVLAAGDNRFGQAEVGAWTGITQVAAGAIHTVGLRADGAVIACGDNTYGQCDVSGWTDVVAVAAASFDTIGLKNDGTVVAAGMHAGKVAGWHGATFVAGGSYSLACLYDKGTMLSSHGGAQMDMDAVLYDLSICGPVSVGVLYDGTLVSSFDGAPDWMEMVCAVATETGILGIDVSGAVRAHFYRPGDAIDLPLSEPAVEIASSGTHHVILTASGTVRAYGANDYGQCEVEGWAL